MTPYEIGYALGSMLGEVFDELAGDKIRADYAAKYGRCEMCEKPLDAPAKPRLCEPCHVAKCLGGAQGGDA